MPEPDDERAQRFKRVIENQLLPQLIAAHLRGEGEDIKIAAIDTTITEGGYPIECSGCGRTARVPHEVPEGVTVLCPQCQPRPDLAVLDIDVLP